ncbi:MAG: hypothetical protein K2X27_02200 [Candidatus Obscuribacterales bacterium]|nr:hypothetical protein [Candidatus Obscuribacterales bacterium]
MDGRFLSKPDVIAASRSFICVRMMTYESASEAEILKSLWRRDAPLENTVFAILDSNGRAILRGGRSPSMLFRDSSELARTMNEISAYYHADKGTPESLPLVASVKLAVDVAACDHLPLAVVLGRTPEERQKLISALAPLAWSNELIGKLIYASGDGHDLKQIKGVQISSGYLFIAPNLFGTEGNTIAQLSSSASRSELERSARQVVQSYRPLILNHHDHVRAGHEEGIEWQTAIPVTDPHSLEAMARDRLRHR